MFSISLLVGSIIGAFVRLLIYRALDYYVRSYYITMVVNSVACFIIGSAHDDKILTFSINHNIELGIVAASATLSTLSTYALDLYTYIKTKDFLTTSLIFLLSHIFGAAFFYIGTLL